MSKISAHINRRTFLTQTATCMSVAALGSVTGPFIKTAHAKSRPQTAKKLFATTDYTDNIGRYQCFLDRAQLDALHQSLASLGVTRHQWIVDTMWTLYEDYPHGFDLLAEAVKSAHAHGIEFYALIKTFEDGGFGSILPPSLPFPKGAPAFRDMRGIYPLARLFAARHPEMCLKRKPGTSEFNGPITTVRLIKDNDEPTRVKAEHVSIWTSTSNNGFKLYTGPVSFRETVEWRPCFPKWKQCRILHLENLKIPKDHTYMLIRCSLSDEKGDFSNENGKIIELVGQDGKTIPHILGKRPITFENHKGFYQSKRHKQLIRYLQLPEVQKEVRDLKKMQMHYDNFYEFDNYKVTDRKTLDKDGFIAAACGKPKYMLGNLHPIYPEVRKHWLDITRFCLDRGVDGINFRMANHTRSPEYWDYGFNEPVLEKSGGQTDYPTISKINGNAFTQFLREAKELIKKWGKGITLHLHATMLMPDNRGRLTPALPPNFEWQWETWVREIADDLEFRGAFKLRPWNLQQVLDTFSAVTRAAHKPLYYQSDFHTLSDDGRKLRLHKEIDVVKNDSGLDGFVLYETANYTRMNKKGGIEIKPYMDDVIKTHFLY